MNQVSLEKWLIPRLGLEKHNTDLEHPIVLTEQWGHQKRHKLTGLPLAKLGQFEPQNKENHNPLRKREIRVSTLG